MKTLTLQEAADLLKLHPVTVAERAADGRIPAAKIGRRQRFGAAIHERPAIMGRNQASGERGNCIGHHESPERKIRPGLFRSKQYRHLHRFGGWNPLGRCP